MNRQAENSKTEPRGPARLPRWLAVLALVLWAQFVFGVGTTVWHYVLILSSDWQVYPSSVPVEYDAFIQLAIRSSPPNAQVFYLSPPDGPYADRYARIHYFLYPRSVAWLCSGSYSSTLKQFAGDLATVDWNRVAGEHTPVYILVDDLKSALPISGQRIDLDASRYILIYRP